MYALSWRLNGPPALPIVGNLLHMWNNQSECDCELVQQLRSNHSNISIEENVRYLDYIAAKYASPVRVWMGPHLYILVTDPKSAETVLRSKACLNKPDVYEAVRHVLGGDGLFTAAGEHWRTHRKLMMPSLRENTVYSHLPVFNYYLENFCQTRLASEADTGKAFDILQPLNICLLEMYLDATFGVEWKYKTEYAKYFTQ